MPVGQEFDLSFDTGFDPPVPTSRTFIPQWLSPDDVKEWLRINDQDSDDDDLLIRVSAMAEPYVQRCRPEWWNTPAIAAPRVYDPDAETYQGAVMYAAREFRRRNSPAGIEAFGETGTTFVSRFDPDIDRALRVNDYAPPTLA
jgi:hypothetical protein